MLVLKSLLLLDLFLLFEVVLLKPLELGIFETLFNVEGEWNCVEAVLSHGFIVQSDVQEHGLFIAQMEVILKFVIKFDA